MSVIGLLETLGISAGCFPACLGLSTRCSCVHKLNPDLQPPAPGSAHDRARALPARPGAHLRGDEGPPPPAVPCASCELVTADGGAIIPRGESLGLAYACPSLPFFASRLVLLFSPSLVCILASHPLAHLLTPDPWSRQDHLPQPRVQPWSVWHLPLWSWTDDPRARDGQPRGYRARH